MNRRGVILMPPPIPLLCPLSLTPCFRSLPACTPDNWQAIKASLLPVIFAGADPDLPDSASEDLDASLKQTDVLRRDR